MHLTKNLAVIGLSEKQLAAQLLRLWYGDKEQCQKELYNHARLYPDTPCSFWYATARLIDEAKPK